METESTLYEAIAGRIAQHIEKGALRPGSKIPSVRSLSKQERVSISTIVQAYRLLEDRGLIEGRPQSGFYVRTALRIPPPEPKTSAPAKTPSMVAISDLLLRTLRAESAKDVIRFGAAVPAAELLPTVALHRAAAMLGRRAGRRSIGYEFPPGAEPLRRQIARHAIHAGCSLSPEEIVITSGGQEALNLALRAVARPGGTIAIESPTYYGILQAIESQGMRALEIPTHPRDGVSLDALRFALEHKKVDACLFVTNHQNPLGSRMPDEAKASLVAMLEAAGVPLIEDDVYGDLGFDGRRPKVAKAFDRTGNVLLCSSFSKTLAPGFRVGWIAPGRYLHAVEQFKFSTSLATATLPQLAIAEFMANGGYQHYLRKARRIYAAQVQEVTRTIANFFPEGTRVTRPQGGFVVWVELPKTCSALALHEKALREKISIAPGPLFTAQRKYRNFIRISCGAPWSPDQERALIRLGQLAAA